jgi:hypothetical protein
MTNKDDEPLGSVREDEQREQRNEATLEYKMMVADVPYPPTDPMPQSGRPRNVYVYDANLPPGTPYIIVAGFWQYGNTTASEFYFNLQLCFQQPPPGQFRLMNQAGVVLARNETIVAEGNYFVLSPGSRTPLIHVADLKLPTTL